MLAINMESVPKIRYMGFVSYKSPWIHFKRNIDEYILYFIKSGELHIEENGGRYVLKKGDIFMLEPNLDHEGFDRHVCDYYYVHFEHPDIRSVQVDDVLSMAKRLFLEENTQPVPEPGEFRNLHDLNLCYMPKHFTLSDKNSFRQAIHAMNEIVQLYKRKHYNRGLTGLKYAEFLIEASRDSFMAELVKNNRRNTKSFVKVHALLDYIHRNYTKPITSAEIEQEFDCNYDYINRVFSEVTGHTIIRYVNLIRINHAKELIEATHLSMNEIGYLTGLNDPFYFSKVFKKYVGLSPTQYYKKIREGV
ncbi:AraC family transcriptional regulator [uncultured Paenibacillus sp.]|uniref:AraC family transcriptional regulator n=1 Tax=uncultured Paenibacillus sp. TaxID=227322 RepID=UPI0028D329C6|nr:AraC family transcriptional regulator [uncultured Paenibacillus sp.]